MHHLRLFYTTAIGFSGCICGSLANKLNHTFLQVNAEPPAECEDHTQPECEKNITDFLETPVCGLTQQPRPLPQGSPGVQGWIHPPGSFKWIEAIAKPNGLETLWRPYEKGGHIFPHFEFPTRIELAYKDFLLCYDNETKTPLWVLEQMTYGGLKSPLKNFFGWCRNDERLPEEFHPTNRDYTRAKQRYKPLLMARLDFHINYPNDSYVFTNVAPKAVKDVEDHGTYDLWDELFHYVYHLSVYHECEHVFLLSGPLYLPKKDGKDGKVYRKYELIGEREIGVPTHFFKVIVSVKFGQIRFECFKFENEKPGKNTDLRQFAVPRDELEREAGFTIFREIEDRKIKYTDMEPEFAWFTYDRKKSRGCEKK